MIKRFYRMPETPHIGCCEPRAYFIPFERKNKASEPRESSGLFTLLSGEWDFRFFSNVEELEIESPDFPACVDCTDKIPVPGCWQLQLGRGYDVPNYINQDYPFPVDPPHLPDVIPCGLYRRRLNFKIKNGKRYFINFEGVSSCFFLWVNGSFVGYSQVSHCTSEFEITNFLSDGENCFETLVVKHCDGSYLEDQDFFRLSGIFRDVYILERDDAHIKDIFIDCNISDSLQNAVIHVDADLDGTVEIHWELADSLGRVIAYGQNSGGFDINVEAPVLWNTENPRLYTLTVNAGGEWMSFPLALRKIEIKNRCLLLNGQKIKLRGINRHDSSPETGYAVSADRMLSDLYTLKRANVNTIRTSHYPNDPRFLEMCGRLGFMVIDEADLECHGMGYNYGDWYWDYWAFLSDSPEWKDIYVDRAKRLFERDKNQGCVIMWSLGNESGCGENHRHMADYIRSRLPKALIHYENAHLEYQARLGKDFTDISDVESRMYAPLDYLEKYINDPQNPKPFFYCEYVAAWSTGDIPLHWDKFEEYDNYCGGCVWEMTDHAVNIGTADKPKYRYGGDFGDWPNDGISCVDGLVFPDGSPRPGYYDMKIAYQPFSAKLNGNRLTIKSKRFFESFDDLRFTAEYEKNGKVFKSIDLNCSGLLPQSAKSFELPEVNTDGFTTLTIYCRRANSTAWADCGYEAGHSQFILSDSPVIVPSGEKHPLSCSESRREITVSCGEIKYTFDKISGRIISVFKDGELLKAPIEFCISRPHHPHSSELANAVRARYDHAKMKHYGCELICGREAAVIKSSVSFAAAAMPPALHAEVIYTFTPDGRLNITVNANVTERAPALPRFGIKLILPKSFENVTYIGCGPVEAYADRFKSQRLSEFNTTVTDSYVHYVHPTESSSHYRTKLAVISEQNGHKISVSDASADGFCFKALHYSDSQMNEIKHDDELTELDETIVSVDYKIHADNQALSYLEPWRSFAEKKFSFSYDIITD